MSLRAVGRYQLLLGVAVGLCVGSNLAADEVENSTRSGGLTVNGEPLSSLLDPSVPPRSSLDPVTQAAPGDVEALTRPTPCFSSLQMLISVGDEVEVRHDRGRSVRGKVVSLSKDRLVIARRQYPFPYFRPRTEETFTHPAVESVDFVDPTGRGLLLGLAAAAPFVVHSLRVKDCGNLCGLPFLAYGLPALLAGPMVGSFVDGEINRTIFQRSGSTRTTISPSLGRHRAGVMVQVSF